MTKVKIDVYGLIVFEIGSLQDNSLIKNLSVLLI